MSGCEICTDNQDCVYAVLRRVTNRSTQRSVIDFTARKAICNSEVSLSNYLNTH